MQIWCWRSKKLRNLILKVIFCQFKRLKPLFVAKLHRLAKWRGILRQWNAFSIHIYRLFNEILHILRLCSDYLLKKVHIQSIKYINSNSSHVKKANFISDIHLTYPILKNKSTWFQTQKAKSQKNLQFSRNWIIKLNSKKKSAHNCLSEI